MPFFIERIFDRRRAWHTHYLPFLERENGWKFDFWIVNVKWNCLMFRVTLLVCRFVVKLDHFLAAECVLFIYYFPSIFWVAFKTWSSHLTLVEDSSEFFSVFIFEKKLFLHELMSFLCLFISYAAETVSGCFWFWGNCFWVVVLMSYVWEWKTRFCWGPGCVFIADSGSFAALLRVVKAKSWVGWVGDPWSHFLDTTLVCVCQC